LKGIIFHVWEKASNLIAGPQNGLSRKLMMLQNGEVGNRFAWKSSISHHHHADIVRVINMNWNNKKAKRFFVSWIAQNEKEIDKRHQKWNRPLLAPGRQTIEFKFKRNKASQPTSQWQQSNLVLVICVDMQIASHQSTSPPLFISSV